MRVLVLGCGSIGRRHLGHLRELGVSELEAADPDPSACERASSQGVRVTQDPEEALERRPAAGLVCTPPAPHLSEPSPDEP